MKITLEKIEAGEEEIVIRYCRMSREISELVEMLSNKDKNPHQDLAKGRRGMLLETVGDAGEDKGKKHLISPLDVYYFESVDGNVYACLEKEVYRIREKLEDVICSCEDAGMVRCSRTMAVNLYKIAWLESQPGGRILASLKNDEKVLISRKYAGLLRRKLKEGGK